MYLPMRVLLLEDPSGASDDISRTLQHHGHEITQVSSEASLGRAGHALSYDLMIVDLSMSAVDPVAVLESQARMGQTARALLLSEGDQRRARAIALGYRERQILSLPLDQARLLAWLTDYAGRTTGGPIASSPCNRRVIAVAGPRPDSGKTTLAAHIACAALSQGLKVATFDLDNAKHTLTRFLDARREHRLQRETAASIPRHRIPNLAESGLEALWHDIERQRRHAEIVILDCPSGSSPATRLAVQCADLLLTPAADILKDISDLAELSAPPHRVRGHRPFTAMVTAARAASDGHRQFEWRLVRNRHTPATSQGRGEIAGLGAELSRSLGLRLSRGLAERPIHRDLSRRGLTLFDLPHDLLASRLGKRGSAVRDEMNELRAITGLAPGPPIVTRPQSLRRAAHRARPRVPRSH
jgi:chromosome partitioning protein